MRYSRSFQVFRMIFRERYREPTLELVLPTMLVSNIFLNAYYERSGFQLLGIVLAFIPIISVSETLAFAIGFRNIVYVTGDHIYKGGIISFITTPVSRTKVFLYIYISDVIVPLVLWLLTTLAYSAMAGIPIPPLVLLTFIAGYFFSENIIFTLTLTLRSPGIITLASLFIVGGIFIFGGIGIYYLLLKRSIEELYLLSFINPYLLWIGQAEGGKFMPIIISGITADALIAIAFFILCFIIFRRLEL